METIQGIVDSEGNYTGCILNYKAIKEQIKTEEDRLELLEDLEDLIDVVLLKGGPTKDFDEVVENILKSKEVQKECIHELV